MSESSPLTARELFRISSSFASSENSDYNKIIKKCLEAAKNNQAFVTIKEFVAERHIVTLIKEGHFKVSQTNKPTNKICSCSFGCEKCLSKDTMISWDPYSNK